MGWDEVDWIRLAQDRNLCRAVVKHSNEPWTSIKCKRLSASNKGLSSMKFSLK
jgi:hypothetical protein